MKLLVCITLAMLIGAAPSPSQSFAFPDFSSTAGLSLNGNAAQVGSSLELASGSNQTGSVFTSDVYPVAAGFDTTFSFQVTSAGFIVPGMAFVIHDDPAGAGAIGGGLQGLGYGQSSTTSQGIARSLAIEIDFLGSGGGDISVQTRGQMGNSTGPGFSIGRAILIPPLSIPTGVRDVRVSYQPGTLSVYFDDLVTPLLTVPYDFDSGGTYLSGGSVEGLGLQAGRARMGFTASTDTLADNIEILSWSWTQTPLPPCLAGTVGSGAGGPFDVLSVNGALGNVQRRVEARTLLPFTINVAQPASSASPAQFALFAQIGNPVGPEMPLGFGTLCFPIGFPNPPGVVTLANTFFPDPQALFASTAAPWTLSFPTGAFPFPITFSVQGIMGESNGGLLDLKVTNVVVVDVLPLAGPSITRAMPLSSATPGTQITVIGDDFQPGISASINGVPVPTTFVSATELNFPYPAGLACDATLTITNFDGQSASTVLNPTPMISSTGLASGPAAGSQLFVVNGSGFAPGTTVTIGGTPAAVVVPISQVLLVTVPPGSVGPATVIITTPGGCLITTTYTYL